jgi:hypothetical protein
MTAQNKGLSLWAISDAHVGTDIRFGRRSLVDAITQSEDPEIGFNWDIAVNLGDFSGNQTAPDDEEGKLLFDQYASTTKHRREDFYDVIGNHDSSKHGEPLQWWFRKWVDPTGENTEFSGVDNPRRRYPVDGTWEHYSFEVGNVLFLMMADRNDFPPPIGRGEKGGFPAGAISGETFDWWTEKVRANPDRIIISCHHHMIQGTTVASDLNEGCDQGYHGRMPEGAPQGSSFIYFVDGEADSGRIENFFDETLDKTGKPAIDMWLGAHTHTHPDDRTGGKSHIETKWGVNFVNVSALTRYHGVRNSIPMSRLLTFTEGSDEVKVQCYLHTSQYAPQGFYPPSERVIKLRHPFKA